VGLPNSSVSQARRVAVYTWRRHGKVLYSYLDLDEIIAGSQMEVPAARKRKPPLPPQAAPMQPHDAPGGRCSRGGSSPLKPAHDVSSQTPAPPWGRL
jgi:hypothetical protein